MGRVSKMIANQSEAAWKPVAETVAQFYCAICHTLPVHVAEEEVEEGKKMATLKLSFPNQPLPPSW